MKKSTIAEMVLHSIMCALFLGVAIQARVENPGLAVLFAFMSGAMLLLIFVDWQRDVLNEAVQIMREQREELNYIITGSRE